VCTPLDIHSYCRSTISKMNRAARIMQQECRNCEAPLCKGRRRSRCSAPGTSSLWSDNEGRQAAAGVQPPSPSPTTRRESFTHRESPPHLLRSPHKPRCSRRFCGGIGRSCPISYDDSRSELIRSWNFYCDLRFLKVNTGHFWRT
jgi:hypothetical protein